MSLTAKTRIAVKPGKQPFSPADNAVLTVEEAARWLRYDRVEQLMDAARRGKVPVMRIGHKTLRFHVRTVLAKFKQQTEAQ